MKTTVNFYSFVEAFDAIRPDNFTREGLSVLFDYLEDYEQDTGEEYELDVIGLCCDFAEGTAEEVQRDYSVEDAQAYLEDEGHLVGQTENTFIYRQH